MNLLREIWIQCHRQSPIFSMESCLVAHEVRIGKDKRASFSWYRSSLFSSETEDKTLFFVRRFTTAFYVISVYKALSLPLITHIWSTILAYIHTFRYIQRKCISEQSSVPIISAALTFMWCNERNPNYFVIKNIHEVWFCN